MPWIKGTTPTIRIGIPIGYDLSEYKIFATVGQGSIEITKSGEEVNVVPDELGGYGCIVEFELTQEETLLFNARKPVEYQLRWVDSSKNASGIVVTDEDVIYKALHDEVITNE